MSDYDEVLFCEKCNDRQMFNVGGTGQIAVCMFCGDEIKGSKIRQSRIKAIKHYERELKTQRFQGVMNKLFDDLNEIANWREK
jgi:hypothetical protein